MVDAAKQPYSSRIIKAGALLSDTRTLLIQWDETLTVSANLERFRSENLFGKASRSRPGQNAGCGSCLPKTSVKGSCILTLRIASACGIRFGLSEKLRAKNLTKKFSPRFGLVSYHGFRREATIVASLSHPHIIKIFDFGEERDVVYLVTEWLQGNSLKRRR